MMSFVSRSLFHSHCFCPRLLMKTNNRCNIYTHTVKGDVCEGVCVYVVVFVPAKTRQEERYKSEKEKRERGVCLCREPV